MTHGDVTGLSTSSGGALGGTVLTIAGSGFAVQTPANNRVLVGGAPCAVVSTAAAELQCVLSPAVVAAVVVLEFGFPGGRGLLWQVRAWRFQRLRVLVLSILDSP